MPEDSFFAYTIHLQYFEDYDTLLGRKHFQEKKGKVNWDLHSIKVKTAGTAGMMPESGSQFCSMVLLEWCQSLVVSSATWDRVLNKLQVLVYNILHMEEGAGKWCSECGYGVDWSGWPCLLGWLGLLAAVLCLHSDEVMVDPEECSRSYPCIRQEYS